MKQIILPINGVETPVQSEHSFVIIGANGSGKSHLGAWIETKDNRALRISAQRALSVPDFVNVRNEKMALNHILYGNDKEAISKIKPRMRHLINVKKLHFLHF